MPGLRRRPGPFAAAVGVLAATAALVSCAAPTRGARATAAAYLAAWSQGSYSKMAAMVEHPPGDFAAVQKRFDHELGLKDASYRLRSFRPGAAHAQGSVQAERKLSALGTWTSQTSLELDDVGGHWKVRWSPQVYDRHLRHGDRFSVSVSWPTRAPILGAGGQPLTTDVAMVHVGVVGSRVKDAAQVQKALVAAGAPPDAAQRALTDAARHPDQFIEVFDLTAAAYQQVAPQIYPIPGTQFERYQARQAITADLAAHVVGTTGPVTAEELGRLGAPYRAGDIVGQTGIEGAYQRQLAGAPGGTVDVVDASGNKVATVASFRPKPGVAVLTTIDPAIQRAAEAAVGGVSQPVALVALSASTGEVLASLSRPQSHLFDDALDGAFPPGSTFKVVTTADLIEHGLTPTSPAPCPATATVGGQQFHNFEGEADPNLDLLHAFARSCNAAFIELVMHHALSAQSFPDTAAQFGLGQPIHMGLSAFGGSVPAPASDAAKAATAIGQSKVVVSPLAMAMVAAAVDAGAVHAPRLVAGAKDDTVPARPLDPTVTADLRQLMTAVVAEPDGTAAGAGLPSGTAGKTGTAEFGTATPPTTHAWFIGYDGDLAFAVLVEGGGVGGTVAAPVASRFLADLGPTAIAAVGQQG